MTAQFLSYKQQKLHFTWHEENNLSHLNKLETAIFSSQHQDDCLHTVTRLPEEIDFCDTVFLRSVLAVFLSWGKGWVIS